MTREIRYSAHLEARLTWRQIPRELPKRIYKMARERYLDSDSKLLIAIKRVRYRRKLRAMMVAYKDDGRHIILITIHPLKTKQKERRIKTTRWQKL